MIALGMLAAEHPGAVPTDVILTNADIFPPLGNLKAFQTALLHDATGRGTATATTPEMLAAVLGASAFMPRRTLADPEIAAPGEMLCPPRRHQRAARHRSVPTRARRR